MKYLFFRQLIHCFTQWQMPASHDLSKTQVVLCHEFGDQQHLSSSTKSIMNIGTMLAEYFDIPIICQHPGEEVALESNARLALIIKENTADKQAYVDTYEVTRQAAAWCKSRNVRSVIICTHPDHAWRAAAIARHHGLIPLIPDLSTVRYDPDCPRLSISTRFVFLPRELCSRLRDLFRKRFSY